MNKVIFDLQLESLAQADLDDIVLYTTLQWGDEQVRRYIRKLEEGMLLLQENPKAGRSYGRIRPGVRMLAVGEHMILYRILENQISIRRILHQAMHLPSYIKTT